MVLELLCLISQDLKASEKYWIKDFLGCEPVLNDYLNTQVVLNALAQYIKGQNTDSYQKACGNVQNY